MIAAWRDEDQCELWVDHVESVELFRHCSSQWRTAAHVVVGLDYAGVHAIAGMLGVAVTPRLFGELRVLESEGVALFGRR